MSLTQLFCDIDDFCHSFLPQCEAIQREIVDDRGEILSFAITRGKIDDRKPLPKLSKNIIGKLFGDRIHC
ncbi:MAG: hypothetical protein IBX55_06930 [Methyloprofundus sp.]|nr:hypothetical protein [Methyloprofundus sp.]MBW6453845.1 transposase [Methyloprofundus sp.]